MWLSKIKNVGRPTRRLAAESDGFVRFLHSYLYFRWPRPYIKLLRWGMERPDKIPARLYLRIGNRLKDTHHSKILLQSDARQLLEVNQRVRLENLEQVLPFEEAKSIIVETSDHFAVMRCACRVTAKDPCAPLETCLVFSQPMVDFVLQKKTLGARRISRQEALDILDREHELGRVHTAWYKDAAADRFYAICNCCRCCCMGMKATLDYGLPVVAPSGRVAVIDVDECTGCGCCEGCYFDALSFDGRPRVDAERCMGCGRCAGRCPAEAVSLRIDPAKPAPFDLSRLLANSR